MRYYSQRIGVLTILVAACWLGPPTTPRLWAQTQEVYAGRRLTVPEAARAVLILNMPIDTRKFGPETTGKAALMEIYDQLSGKGLESAWLVDSEMRNALASPIIE